MFILTCEECGQKFERRRIHRFCSRDCVNKARKKLTGPLHPRWKGGKRTYTCKECHKDFEERRRQSKERKFCSPQCQYNAARKRIGLANPGWKGGRHKTTEGYIILNLHGGKFIYEHRYVMEKALGRLLRADEEVHHIDGNKANNDLSNLVILVAQKHKNFHPYIPHKSPKYNCICIVCGSSFVSRYKTSLRCKKCQSRIYWQKHGEERKAKHREYYIRNADKIKAQKRSYRQNHKITKVS